MVIDGYNIVLLRRSPPGVSFAAPPLTCVTYAAQCRFWQRIGCCILLLGVSFWSLGPIQLLSSKEPFRLRAHQYGIISPLSCVPCCWPALPNFTSPFFFGS